ncbi:MAG: aromatic amino acid transport family protein [Nanoarchaeota archaeon]
MKIDIKTKKILTAISIIIGTVVGVGFLSMPYVAVKSGFLVTMGYLFVFGFLILLINLYFGEIILRTKGEHQLVGYAYKCLGKKAKDAMFVLVVLAIFSALLAYMIGVGESLSYLIFGNIEYEVMFGALFGFFMSYLIWRGVFSLRKYEKIGVGALILMLVLITIVFGKNLDFSNYLGFNKAYIFLPFGVILFSLIEFFSLPSVVKVLKKNEILTKKVIVIGSIIVILIYALFTFLIIGHTGESTPQVSTIALGPVFILIGLITMFTSYLALGIALERSFMIDYRDKKRKAWFKSTIIPIILFLFLEIFEFFSFINIITIGGIIAGGLIVILVLAIHRKARTQGNRIPEYQVYLSKTLAILISILFILGIIVKIISFFI